MSLKEYQKKRNFSVTSEPKGNVVRKNVVGKKDKKSRLYAIQKHAASHLHYDFRIELNGVLKSWAVPKGPSLDPSVKRLAMHVEDHPIEYGNFEGIIPQGEYGGGTVMLWDLGEWIPDTDDPNAAYQKGHLSFFLKGKKLKGRWSLIKFKKADDKSWFLIKSNDQYAKHHNEYDITTAKPNSVLSKQSIDEIAKNFNQLWNRKGLQKVSAKTKKKILHEENPQKFSKYLSNKSVKHPKILLNNYAVTTSTFPRVIHPEKATLVDTPPNDDNWLHEIKFDGYRLIAFIVKNKIRLMSRNDLDWTMHFKNVANELLKLYQNQTMVLDGEVVLLDDRNHSNFQLLQNSIKGENQSKEFIYYVFDILYYDHYNLKKLSLIERKNILKTILGSNQTYIRYSDHIIGNGKEVFTHACEMGLEGIISKKTQSTYQEKRTKDWLKIKCIKRQEFIIGGYTPPKKSREYFGSLYLGYFDKDKKTLIYCGNVGTGFTRASLKSIYKLLQKYKIDKNPFNIHPPGYTSACWIKPCIVAEIEFIEMTNEGLLRHPSFKGLREDKKPQQVMLEKAKATQSILTSHLSSMHKNKIQISNKMNPKKNSAKTRGLIITHPNKLIYPEDNITKLEVIEYYEFIQDWMLPYVTSRPLTLVRCPENYKKCFYQKHLNKTMPKELHAVPIKSKHETEQYIYIKDFAGLIALIQLRVLEIHPWASLVSRLENPNYLTLDLDPGDDVPWKQTVNAALAIRKHLQNYQLKSFVKTTGGKGLHVVVPILPEYTWEEVKEFSHTFVKFLVLNEPEKYIGEMSKKKRSGKIFVDYLRNQRDATAVAPYSTRARIHAPISTPLHWDELSHHYEDNYYTLKTLPNRMKKLKSDPWKDFFKIKQSLRIPKKIE